MASFIDALLGRTKAKPVAVHAFSNVATVGQPVPTAMITEPPSQLSSGSSLNRAAKGAWPNMLDGNNKFLGGWVKSFLKEVEHQNVAGNYGMVTSQAHFQFRYRAFAGKGTIGALPIDNVPTQPVWNELTPIVWNVRVANTNLPSTVEPSGAMQTLIKPVTYTAPGTASVRNSGITLL